MSIRACEHWHADVRAASLSAYAAFAFGGGHDEKAARLADVRQISRAHLEDGGHGGHGRSGRHREYPVCSVDLIFLRVHLTFFTRVI